MPKMLRKLILYAAFSLCLAATAMAQGPFAYIANMYAPPYSGEGFVSVIDTSTNSVVAYINTGGSPSAAVFDPSGTRVYVADNGIWSPRVWVIDTCTNTVVATVPIGTGRVYAAIGLAISPDGRRLYVTEYITNAVYVVDTTTYTQVNAIAVGDMPHGVAVNPAGTRLYVANWGGGSLSVVDTSTETVVKTIPLMLDPPRWFGTNGGSNGVAVNRAGTRVYVTNFNDDSVSVIDATSDTVLALVPVGLAPTGVAVNPEGTRVYVANRYSGTLSVIETSTNTVVATIGDMEQEPTGVAVTPSGEKVYVTAYRSGKVVVIDAATNTIVDRVTQGIGSYSAYGIFIGPANEIVDAVPPVIAPHENLVVEAMSASGAVVNYTSPVWTDTVAGSGVASCAPASGSVFPIGATTVVCTATDGKNVSESYFTVTVRDSTKPTVTATADVTELWPANGKMRQVTVVGMANDGGSGVTASGFYYVVDEYGIIQPAGTFTVDSDGKWSFPVLLEPSRLGTDRDGRLYTIVITVKDVAGNSTTTTLSIVVPHDKGK